MFSDTVGKQHLGIIQPSPFRPSLTRLRVCSHFRLRNRPALAVHACAISEQTHEEGVRFEIEMAGRERQPRRRAK